MRTNIAAFTGAGGAPAFVSVNLDTNDDSVIEITVRSEAKAGGVTGDIAVMTMSAAQFQKFACQLYAFACTGAA